MNHEIVLNEYEGNRQVRVSIKSEYHHNALPIGLDGYGEHSMPDGYGLPILIEIWQGRLRVLIWNDINKEDPIVIDMEGARESNRKEVQL